ncbi:MAG TPA: hypothetical protein VGJ87_20850 [Roseiflexaceae bacterium]|jgi:hypothetical protein
MGLLIVALALFIGMIVCWIVLPGGTSASIAHHEVERVSPTAVEQLA